MTQQQLSREIEDFAFWQHTKNECDRGYVRSGNSVMRRALDKLTEETIRGSWDAKQEHNNETTTEST